MQPTSTSKPALETKDPQGPGTLTGSPTGAVRPGLTAVPTQVARTPSAAARSTQRQRGLINRPLGKRSSTYTPNTANAGIQSQPAAQRPIAEWEPVIEPCTHPVAEGGHLEAVRYGERARRRVAPGAVQRDN